MQKKFFWLVYVGAGILVLALVLAFKGQLAVPIEPGDSRPTAPVQLEGASLATFGAGCFWCTEAVFQQLSGVRSVISGYSGGALKNPTYDDICTGMSGHAEVVQVAFDPAVISYDQLLLAFWHTHDPTTLNRQGNDVGPQYRSVIFYHTDEQKKAAEASKRKLDAARVFPGLIVTEIVPAADFYRAENYHQNYYRNNPNRGYCQFIIRPKLEKLKQALGHD